MDVLLFLTSAIHMIYTPFTKVEESFNLQAIHDILYLRHNFTQYDHHEFPGVVPRTFLGPLFISILSSPFVLLFEALDISKFWTQYVVRLILAAVVTTAWTKLKRIITKLYGWDVSLWFSVITLTQFHFIFYMSRTLPNIMALPIVLYALAYWLNGNQKPFIVCSGISILVFRFELIIFFGLLLLFDLLFKKITIDRILKIALPAGIVILASTITVDSFFWKRLLWPEGEVLWYNTILNKSSDWGTSPFLWYFYSALPRAMGVSLLFVPLGFILERRIRSIVIAAIAFVLIYSILPHKELRFIIYVFPVLNISAATACHRFWSNSAKSVWHGFLSICAGGHLLANILITIFLLMVSSTNYPGGVALRKLHRLETQTVNVSVHISNLAAQSGVTRFLQTRNDWRYCKRENMNYTQEETIQYTHLLMEAKNKLNTHLWSAIQEDFETVDFIECFSSIGIQYNSIMPVKIKTKPCLAIVKRKLIAIAPKEVTKTTKERKAKRSIEGNENTKNFIEPLTITESKKTSTPKESKENIETKSDKIEKNKTEHNNEPLQNNNVEEQTDKKSRLFSKETKDKSKTSQLHVTSAETLKAESDLVYLLSQGMSLEDDAIVSTVESYENLPTFSEEANDSVQLNKEINFQELHNLALGQVNRKTRATKLKIRKIIEEYYRSKGKHIENDSKERQEKISTTSPSLSTRQSVKAIIKQERIKEMIEQISTMDLTKICDLEKVSTKDCLKLVIDKIDEDGNTLKTTP